MPALLVGVLVYLSVSVCDYYGLACAALGMVATTIGTGAALSLFGAAAKLCAGLNSLAKDSDAHGSSHASFAGMVASGSSTTRYAFGPPGNVSTAWRVPHIQAYQTHLSMLYCVRACATAVLAYATIAAVLLRSPVANTYGEPGGDAPRIGEGGDPNPPLQSLDARRVGMYVLEPVVLLAAVVGASYPFTISSMCAQTATKVAASVVAESEVQLMRRYLFPPTACYCAFRLSPLLARRSSSRSRPWRRWPVASCAPPVPTLLVAARATASQTIEPAC